MGDNYLGFGIVNLKKHPLNPSPVPVGEKHIQYLCAANTCNFLVYVYPKNEAKKRELSVQFIQAHHTVPSCIAKEAEAKQREAKKRAELYRNHAKNWYGTVTGDLVGHSAVHVSFEENGGSLLHFPFPCGKKLKTLMKRRVGAKVVCLVSSKNGQHDGIIIHVDEENAEHGD